MSDFALVCANCHRMLHRQKNSLMTVEELRLLIASMRQYFAVLCSNCHRMIDSSEYLGGVSRFREAMSEGDGEPTRDLQQLRRRLRQFVAERDWQRFPSPKNLAIAVSVEAGQLLELFRCSSDGGARGESRDQIAAEIADLLGSVV